MTSDLSFASSLPHLRTEQRPNLFLLLLAVVTLASCATHHLIQGAAIEGGGDRDAGGSTDGGLGEEGGRPGSGTAGSAGGAGGGMAGHGGNAANAGDAGNAGTPGGGSTSSNGGGGVGGLPFGASAGRGGAAGGDGMVASAGAGGAGLAGMGGAAGATSCTGDNECRPNGYCEGQTCRPLKAASALCTRSEECSSKLCGGRCCEEGKPCKCTQPSSTNLFKNAGFDRDVSQWRTTDTVAWSVFDAEDCRYSGSAKYTGSASGDPDQRVVVQPGLRYNLGGLFRKDDGGTWDCYLSFYPRKDCTGEPGADNVLGHFRDPTMDYKPSDWMAYGTSVVSPSWALCAELSCDVNNTWIDHLYLSPEPDGF